MHFWMDKTFGKHCSYIPRSWYVWLQCAGARRYETDQNIRKLDTPNPPRISQPW